MHPKGVTPFDRDWGRVDPVAGLARHFTPKMAPHADARTAQPIPSRTGASLLFLK